MKSVNIDRARLLHILKDNRATHIKDVEAAMVDYKAACLKIATDNLKLVKTGDAEKIALCKSLPGRPGNYADNYSQAIRMLELSEDHVIELESGDFKQLVMDEWSWKQHFVATSAMYKTLT